MSFEFTKEEIIKNVEYFHDVHRMELIGGQVFSRGNNWVSKLISKVTKEYDDGFEPSHVGQIIMLNTVLYVFDMKPPRGKITELKEWLRANKDDYRVILRPFDFDVLKYCADVAKRINKKYPYWSAIQCKLKINYDLPTPKDEDEALAKKAEHCSEITIREMQKFGYFLDINANKATPEQVYHLYKEL